jgi:hypothetical protein
MAHDMLGLTLGDDPVTPKTPRQRQPVWLTPEAVAAADRLSRVTGLTLHELVEIALLGIDADQLARELGVAGAASAALAHDSRAARGAAARVIPIERGRLHSRKSPRRAGAHATDRSSRPAVAVARLHNT